MDVINFSGGGPESEPANDAMIETIRNVAAAGVVPVISAGNDRDDFGYGTAGSPGTAPDAISVAAVSNTQVFAPVLGVVAAGAPPSVARIPFRPTGAAGLRGRDRHDARRRRRDRRHRRAARRPAASAARPRTRTAARARCPRARSRARSRSSGAACARSSRRRSGRGRRVRPGSSSSTTGPGEANGVPALLELPLGHDRRPRRRAPARVPARARAGARSSAIGGDEERIETGRGGTITSFSSAGPDRVRPRPEAGRLGARAARSCPRRSRTPAARSPSSTGRAWRRRTSPARPRCSSSGIPAGRRAEVKSALVSTAGAAYADTARTVEAPVLLGGGGLVDLPRADDPQGLHATRSRSRSTT